MQETYTAREIAEALGLGERAIRKRANKERWSVQLAGHGKSWRTIAYVAASLPADVRAAIIAHEAQNLPASPDPSEPALSEAQRAKALAKADLVRLYVEALTRAPHGNKTAARDGFMTAYHAGAWPRLLALLGRTSWKSIERWKLTSSATGSALRLADTRGGQRVASKLTERHCQLLLNLARHPNKPCISEVCRMAREAFKAAGLPDCHDVTMRRFLERWSRQNYGEWIFAREGKKAWNDKCCPYIERDYSKIAVGDILVADGHALNFEILDPETGQGRRMELVLWYDMASSYPCGWEILPTENVRSIAAAFRRACMRLGSFPKVAYLDNGKAFKARFFTGIDLSQTGLSGVFTELGVEPLFAWPYHGQSKTIERFFETFGELERWVPSYVGTGIDSKPPRLMRGEKLHRKVYDASGGRPLTLEEAHTAIAIWFDAYAERPQRGHLKGQAPRDVFEAGRGSGLTDADMQKLRMCMLSKSVRSIDRNGVSLHGKHYYHPLLHHLRHKVLVRYDDQGRDSILIYDEAGKQFICEATPRKSVHPAARILGNAEDQAILAEEIGLKKALEHQVTANARAFLKEVVLPETQSRMRLIEAKKTVPAAVPAPKAPDVVRIEEGKSAARAKLAEAPAYVPPAQIPAITTELDRYEYLFNLAVRDGVALREADADWMARYEQTGEYAACARGRYEQLRQVYARRRAIANGGVS
ncbi:transposase [Desulfovibrio sulfodismutans]|uniref:Transposase n=1 Tax=Desulfolutivibrio sulfodismutans TaxID=63561 RepID=A0A7K3NHA4_9BACT|nr:Mu transposase C-terminal domain-containing protein [Desulfolutivibrio sulfodismutans]NDY55581.1 transposase [Desulfolutivibrio sulfodismutans]QLA11482.1 transposase [Desulfolutivibrio sulfodismutans DSM 3696]